MAASQLINVLVVALLVAGGLAVLLAAVRIVTEYQRLVVFRLGRLLGQKGPGLVLLIPFVDRAVRVDLRERFFDVPPQTTITADNAHLAIDFLVYSKVVDAVPSVINVEDHVGAARGIAITTLRAVVGSMLLDDVLAKREEINVVMREKLDEVTNRWGVKVTAVEIREITPPMEIQQAMTRQMSAERTRRATVTEADGRRDATIRVAEGDKRATILRAEGDREATVLRATGYAEALHRIHEVAAGLDGNTMVLQYLEVLRTVGQAPSTKLLIPAELTGLLQPLVRHAQAAAEAQVGGPAAASGPQGPQAR